MMSNLACSLPRHWSRRALLALVSLAALAAPLGSALAADDKPITLLVGFPAGGGTDAIARALASKLKDELGRNVIVENKPGAGGLLAAQALKAAPADGHTLFLSHDHSVSIIPLVMKNPGFDPAKDFTPVAGFATFVNAFAVSGATPAKSLPEYVAWVKAQGGKGAVGVPAPASMPEFLVGAIGRKYQLDLVAAPYRGSAPMILDMLGNQIAAGTGSVPDFIDNHKNGKLRVVAVMGKTRQQAMPDVPTLAELGLAGFEEVPYYGIFAPAGTERAVIERYTAALGKVLAQPELHQRLTDMGLSVGLMSSQQLGAREAAYRQTMARVIKDSGFTPQ